jgi:hypothetical protein
MGTQERYQRVTTETHTQQRQVVISCLYICVSDAEKQCSTELHINRYALCK